MFMAVEGHPQQSSSSFRLMPQLGFTEYGHAHKARIGQCRSQGIALHHGGQHQKVTWHPAHPVLQLQGTKQPATHEHVMVNGST